ncbi:hypothetical protein OHQ89_22385 [Streptomyces canus]|uniref:hypothetical protein n=1 Tax=Streptomyces canus TaxID=58343 RepID=UPI0030E046A4
MSGGSAWTGAAVAAVTAGYALLSRRLASTPVSAPMVFTGFGVLIGLDVLDLGHDAGPVLTLVEAALALMLFTDSISRRGRKAPVRRSRRRTVSPPPMRRSARPPAPAPVSRPSCATGSASRAA